MTRMPRLGIGAPFLLLALGCALTAGRPIARGPSAAVTPDSLPIPVLLLEARRTALLERLEPGVAILRSADPRREEDYPQDSDFRQDNDFYYLTGLETPGSWLVVYKDASGGAEVVLYLPERNPRQEIWTGKLPGPGPETARRTGIADVRAASRFQADVRAPLLDPQPAATVTRVYLPLRSRLSEVQALVDAAKGAGRSVIDLGEPLAELRMVKDSAELAWLRRAVAITAEAQRTAMRALQPEMHEYELEAIIEYIFRARGAQRLGFPSVVGSGPNSVILHHDDNRRLMHAGDLVVVDVGAEVGYYSADITRTLPVSGKFTERQAAIYNLVLATQQTVIDSIRPGKAIWQLELMARNYMRQNSGELCAPRTCDQYFLHGLSHWLGMDVHDVGSYRKPLAPGMVLTVEPGIYLADENLGVRIEDDVLVTAEGNEVLSVDVPRTIEEIESLMATGRPALPCDCR